MRNIFFLTLILPFPLMAASLCGTTITKDLNLKEDLICPTETASVLTVTKKDITINGNGYKIIAPRAETVIRILENNVTVKNIDLSGDGVGRGVEIYNAKKAKLTKLIIHHRRIGIDAYFDQRNCDSLTATHNEVTDSEVFALRITAPDCSGSHKIENNDFRGSKDFALYFSLKKLILCGLSGNRLDHSRNGIFISARYTKVSNLDLSQTDILENPLYISQSKKVWVDRVDVSTTSHPGIGLHIYDSSKVKISRFISRGHAIGVKIAGEKDRLKKVKICHSAIEDNGTGILLTSYNGAYLNLLSLAEMSLMRNPTPLTVNLGILKKVQRRVQL